MVFSFSWVLLYKWVNPPMSTLMIFRWITASEKIPIYNLRLHWIPLDMISPYIIPITITGEDPNFFYHKGYYMGALWDGFKKKLRGEDTPGYSTITMQTAKNLFLYPHKTYLRKILQVYFAILMEWLWSKERILEIYLNIIEFSKGVYGINSAACTFFSKQASDLSLDEGCCLIAVLSNPFIHHPINLDPPTMWRATFLYTACYPYSNKLHYSQPNTPPLRRGIFGVPL